MKLGSVPFELIRSGKKTIESRLWDEKRQAISVGDEIIFSEKDNPKKTITAHVVDLLRYPKFSELFAAYDPILFGIQVRNEGIKGTNKGDTK